MRTRPTDATFLDARQQTDLAALDADIAILGVPHGSPYPEPGQTAGCADAPAAVRRRSQRLARFRGHWDFDLDGPLLPTDGSPRLVDAGDVPGEPLDGGGNGRRTREAVSAVLASGAVPICLGGDDSVPIPILRAFEGRGPLTVVQVDAHLDFRDEVSGVRDGYSSPMRRASEMSHVERIVQVGLRGVGSARPADVEDARAAGNRLITAIALRERGIPWLLAEIGDASAVFVSFDADGLDPAVCPAVSAPAPGGLSYADALALLAGLRTRLVGAAFTEFVPALDRNETGALVIARLVAAAVSSARA